MTDPEILGRIVIEVTLAGPNVSVQMSAEDMDVFTVVGVLEAAKRTFLESKHEESFYNGVRD